MPEKNLDKHVRESLHVYLKKELAPDAAVIDELVLHRKDGRADVVVVSDTLHCYEIKSDSDRLDRLKRQVRVYGKVFDYLSVVTTEKHFDHALKAVPAYWGAFIWYPSELIGGAATVLQMRRPTLNVATHLPSLTQLLWKGTALRLLQEVDTIKGLSARPKWFIWARVQEVCTQAQIHQAVVHQLKNHRRTESAAYG